MIGDTREKITARRSNTLEELAANRAELDAVLNAVQDEFVYTAYEYSALRDRSAEQREVWDYLCLLTSRQVGPLSDARCRSSFGKAFLLSVEG